MYATYDHFSQIAPKYSGLRTTDSAPIRYLSHKLGKGTAIRAADVGCGSGRYDGLLFRRFREQLDLICIDENESMLRELRRELAQYDGHLQVLCGRARALPLAEQSLDGIFTFNAVHHFKIASFLQEAGRVLKPSGKLFIYTRTRTQNAKNIWGKYFPKFHEKEDRLFELSELQALVAATPGLQLDRIRVFNYRRLTKLPWLLRQALHRHYSTFDLYEDWEFKAALREFKHRLVRAYWDPNEISWIDENLMLVVKKTA